MLKRAKARLVATDRARVKMASQSYGSERAEKFFNRTLAEIHSERQDSPPTARM